MFNLSRLIFTRPILTALVAIGLTTQPQMLRHRTSAVRFDVEIPGLPRKCNSSS